MVQSKARRPKVSTHTVPTNSMVSTRIETKTGPLDGAISALAQEFVAGPHSVKVFQSLKTSGFRFKFFALKFKPGCPPIINQAAALTQFDFGLDH
jgi:hypothetical protein